MSSQPTKSTNAAKSESRGKAQAIDDQQLDEVVGGTTASPKSAVKVSHDRYANQEISYLP